MRRRILLGVACVAVLALGPSVWFVDDWRDDFYDHGLDVAVGLALCMTAILAALFGPALLFAVTRDARENTVKRSASFAACVLLAHVVAVALASRSDRGPPWLPLAVYPAAALIAFGVIVTLDRDRSKR